MEKIKINELRYKTYDHLKINSTMTESFSSEKIQKEDLFSDYAYGMSANFIENHLAHAEVTTGDKDAELYIDRPESFDTRDIVLAENEQRKLTLTYSLGEESRYSSSLIRIYAAPNSILDIDMVSLGDFGKRHENVVVVLEDQAKVNINHILLSGENTHINHTVYLKGAASEFNEKGLYFGSQKQELDLFYDIIHIGEKTVSDLTVHGALRDRAHKVFRSTLDFKEGAKSSQGSETEDLTLLSDDATNIQVPVLLCHEDDVIGNHAASCGSIDEEKLFYLLSRGICRDEAISLIIKGKFTPLLDQLADDTLRERIWDMISKKLG